MPDVSRNSEALNTVRSLQIIVGAFSSGAIIFLSIASIIGPQINKTIVPLPIPLYIAVLLLVGIGMIVRFVYIKNLSAKARREISGGTYQPINYRERMRLPPASVANQSDDSSRDFLYLVSAFRYITICSAAIIEGWCFFATMAYLIEGNPISLGLAILLTLCVAAHFPTQSRANRWVKRELAKLKE
jgi:hypothetical protein